MNIKICFYWGWKHSMGRRKKAGHGMVMLAVSVVLLMLLVCVSSSISNLLNDEIESLSSRKIHFNVEENDACLEPVIKKLEQDSRVASIVKNQSSDGTVELQQSEGLELLDNKWLFYCYSDWVEDYMVAEVNKEEYLNDDVTHWVIVPLYLFDNTYVGEELSGYFKASEWQDGRELLGKTITVTHYCKYSIVDEERIAEDPEIVDYALEHHYSLPEKKIIKKLSCEAVIVGVYDNRKIGADEGLPFYCDSELVASFLELDDACEMERRAIEADYQEIEYGDEYTHMAAVVYQTKDVENVKKVIAEYLQDNDVPVNSIWTGVENYYDMVSSVRFAVHLVPGLAVIFMVLSVITLLAESKRETDAVKGLIGMQAALGMEQRDLIIVRMLERSIRVVKVFIPCLLFYSVMVAGVNYLILNKANYKLWPACLEYNYIFMVLLFIVLAAVYILTDVGTVLSLLQSEPEHLLTERE